jgi:mono/diheme cytochrome c family protein
VENGKWKGFEATQMDAKRRLSVLSVALIIMVAASAVAQTPPTSTPSAGQAAARGDAKKGKALFEQTYRCYACHGFDGQSGSPRLVPMARTEEAFIAYIRKPSTPAMPTFADAPTPDLADVYAYLRSLRADAPPIESIPLLKDILDQVKKN